MPRRAESHEEIQKLAARYRPTTAVLPSREVEEDGEAKTRFFATVFDASILTTKAPSLELRLEVAASPKRGMRVECASLIQLAWHLGLKDAHLAPYPLMRPLATSIIASGHHTKPNKSQTEGWARHRGRRARRSKRAAALFASKRCASAQRTRCAAAR